MTRTIGRPKLYEAEVKTKLTEEQIRGLDSIAEERGVTRSDVIRVAIDSQLFVMNRHEGQDNAR